MDASAADAALAVRAEAAARPPHERPAAFADSPRSLTVGISNGAVRHAPG